MEGKVIFEGKSNKGTGYIIRYPKREDVQSVCDYINKLSSEQTFVRFQGEKVSFEHENEYIKKQIERIENHQSVELFVIHENKVIGISGVDLKDKTESHEGVLGISVSDNFRGEGIGKKLMELVINEAANNLPKLKIITLGLFGNNDIARKMYEEFGFKEYGRLPGGVYRRGQYEDHVYMYKEIKK